MGWQRRGREEENRLNYAFDTTLTNPVSAQVGQPVIGGIRFAGVDGAPETPWKFDKNNFQLRAGMAYSINEKTVLRAGYGKYYLNPTAQSFNNGFSLATPVIASNDGNRTPTYALGNPWPNGIQEPPGSSLGPRTFLGRSPSFSDPNFIVPNVAPLLGRHPARAAVGRRAGGQLRRQPQPRHPVELERLQRAVGGVPAPVRRDARRQPRFCDQLLPNPFFRVPGFEGTARFTNPTLSRFELARPSTRFTATSRLNERNDGTWTYDSMQFVANKRWAKGLTLNATYTWVPRWTETGADTTTNIGEVRRQRVAAREQRPVLLAPRAPDHRVGRVGAARPWPPRLRRHAARRLVDCPDVHLPVGPAVDHAGQRRPRGRSGGRGAERREGRAVHLRRQAVRRPAQRRTGSYDLLSVSTAYGCTEPFFLVREAFQRRTAMVRYDEFRRPTFWQVDLNFAKTTPITDRVRLQFRIEAFNIFNSPMYDEREYNQTTTSADFGRINRNTTGQNNFQRFVQLGFRLTF